MKRLLRNAAGALGYGVALAAVAGMAIGVRLGRLADRVMRPVDEQANRCWGGDR